MNSVCLIFTHILGINKSFPSDAPWRLKSGGSSSLAGFSVSISTSDAGFILLLTACRTRLAQSVAGYLRKLRRWRGSGEGVGHHGAKYVQVIVVLACARATVVSWYSCWCVCDTESGDTGFTGAKYVGRRATWLWHNVVKARKFGLKRMLRCQLENCRFDFHRREESELVARTANTAKAWIRVAFCLVDCSVLLLMLLLLQGCTPKWAQTTCTLKN